MIPLGTPIITDSCGLTRQQRIAGLILSALPSYARKYEASERLIHACELEAALWWAAAGAGQLAYPGGDAL